MSLSPHDVAPSDPETRTTEATARTLERVIASSWPPRWEEERARPATPRRDAGATFAPFAGARNRQLRAPPPRRSVDPAPVSFFDAREPLRGARGTFAPDEIRPVRPAPKIAPAPHAIGPVPVPISATRSRAGPTDAALVLAVRAGEAWAHEALFRRHAPLVNGLAYRLMGRSADAEDLVQDAFTEAFRGLDRLDDPQSFAKWLGSIVVRTASKTIRRQRLMARLGLHRRRDPIDVETIASRVASPELSAELHAIYEKLEPLPTEQRVAFTLRRIERMPLTEVAATLSLSTATVKRRVAAAEAALGLAEEAWES
jgi:RNA polymerase sigma-70 factor (ECF subfamily)